MQEKLINLHLPRYKELPEIDLYADQVISYLNRHLSIFTYNESESLITRTMINNYVKQGVVSSPIKKKYNRKHLAYLFVVCILKNAYSIPEVTKMIAYQISVADIEKSYDTFCDQLEDAMNKSYNNQNYTFNEDDDEKNRMLKIVINSIVCKAKAQAFLSRIVQENPHIGKRKK